MIVAHLLTSLVKVSKSYTKFSIIFSYFLIKLAQFSRHDYF